MLPRPPRQGLISFRSLAYMKLVLRDMLHGFCDQNGSG